jgi:hypothetical protein
VGLQIGGVVALWVMRQKLIEFPNESAENWGNFRKHIDALN